MYKRQVKGAAAVIILLGDLTAYTVANADEISAKMCIRDSVYSVHHFDPIQAVKMATSI